MNHSSLTERTQFKERLKEGGLEMFVQAYFHQQRNGCTNNKMQTFKAEFFVENRKWSAEGDFDTRVAGRPRQNGQLFPGPLLSFM